jgi:methionine synthase II (cobalamin-independent)
VAEVVGKQMDAGIDVVSDGEQAGVRTHFPKWPLI